MCVVLSQVNSISFIFRSFSERFLELRRIQLGERPVTGSNTRETLETFFHRAIHGPTEQERQREEEANRPDHVTHDVQLLLQRQVVRSALQTDFRSHLEQTLNSRHHPQAASAHPSQPQRRRNIVGNTAFRSQLERLFGDRHGQTQQSTTNQRRHINRYIL